MKENGEEIGSEELPSPHSKELLGRIEAIQKESNQLFDIASCKCMVFKACKCPNPIPKMERSFLTDQRGTRKLYIGVRDPKFVHRRPRPVTQSTHTAEPEPVPSVSSLRTQDVSAHSA